MEIQDPAAKITKTRNRRWIRIILLVLAVPLILLVIGFVSIGLYIQSNKDDVLIQVSQKLNENLDGKLVIGDLKPEFFSGFPRVSLRLVDVALTDRHFADHNRKLLSASKIDVSVNVLALISGTVEIRKIAIEDASVDIFVTADGYSNTSVFKKKPASESKSGGTAFEWREFRLENVAFRIENSARRKLHHYKVNKLDGKVDPRAEGWQANVDYDILVESMSFNTKHGSFSKNKRLKGKFDVRADGLSNYRLVQQPIDIGNEHFTLAAEFSFEGTDARFAIHLVNKKILWKNVAALLSGNISEKLLLFDMSKPIEVRCDLEGDFNSFDDPLIYVQAKVRNNDLQTPGGLVSKCNFDGTFANNYNKKKPLGDANSVILLRNLSGEYGTVPFSMPVISIADLDNPTAKGKLISGFELTRVNSIVDKNLLDFKAGKAEIDVDFTADVIDHKLARPKILGKIAVSNANLIYGPKKIGLEDVSVNLDFNSRDLFIRNIHIKTAKSDVLMDGKVENFLNLYYIAPEKIVLNWNVYSKKLDLMEFAGLVAKRQTRSTASKKKGNFTSELNEFMESSSVRMAMKIDKLSYNKFSGSEATAIVDITESGMYLKKAGLKHAGGRIQIEGELVHAVKRENYRFSAKVKDVNVRTFFQSFDNFGMETLTSKNLSGKLSLDAKLSGHMTGERALLPKSMQGKCEFSLRDGALLNFEPIQSVGKIAFRRRDIQNIAFKDLHGMFEVKGEKVHIAPMKISSNVLNLDVEGVYSFGSGTNLLIDVPLRNPKKDEEISDEAELEKRRHRGIVLHLLASDDPESGKVRISVKGKRASTQN
ncbi:AsmA family protein [Flavobacterium selenitireducens]|uniref:AsmA family protein n=1 Tax=Flavobacterium selenitireducens TaxID=2722704 RepID=UPI00168A7E5C|nr:AsmA family protein [Flavobacterium selenitireducens]MBD3582217.1 AsmA family protein [Flavobacterium selenitireducens]